MFSERFLEIINKKWKKRKKELKGLGQELANKIEGLAEEEKEAVLYLYAVMPQSDCINYPFELFLEYAEHGVLLRKQEELREQEECSEQDGYKKIPEDIFAAYVLSHRVNNEEVQSCRPFFYSMIQDKLKGKTMYDKAVEVNYWCAGEVTYQSTDDRTAGAISVYQAGAGRCGEESTFVVHAMRSVGIPARQVYAPYWSHCNDNHAWVEIYNEGNWYFLGACEPEEQLNHGWFVNAASRAMMVRSFCLGEELMTNSLEAVGRDGVVTYQNELKRYAKTKKITVMVTSEDGMKIANAKVSIQVLNYSEFAEIAVFYTNEQGKISFTTGIGSIHFLVTKDKKRAEKIIDLSKESEEKEILISLKSDKTDEKWQEFIMTAPKDRIQKKRQTTKEEKEFEHEKFLKACNHRIEKLKQYESLYSFENLMLSSDLGNQVRIPEEWNKFISDLLIHAAGNVTELVHFLTEKETEHFLIDKIKLLKKLSKKDAQDCSYQIIMEHFLEGISYKEECLKETSEEIFYSYVLNPRIAQEPLTAYKKQLKEYYKEKAAELKQNPKEWMKWLKEEIVYSKAEDFSELIVSPVQCAKYKWGSIDSIRILFIAACRSFGIPARLHPIFKTAEYFKNGTFLSAEEVTENNGNVSKEFFSEKTISDSIFELFGEEEHNWCYAENFTIARYQDGNYHTLCLGHIPWKNGMTVEVKAGEYKIITSNRLPNGTIYAKLIHCYLKQGEKKRIKLEMKEAALKDMLMNSPLVDFTVLDSNQNSVEGRSLCTEKKIFLWLEEGKEPTEHILNELIEKKEEFQKIQQSLIFIVKGKKAWENKTFHKAKSYFPNSSVYYDETMESQHLIARRMYAEPDKFPLVLIADFKFQGIYAAGGYHVGMGTMLSRLFSIES